MCGSYRNIASRRKALQRYSKNRPAHRRARDRAKGELLGEVMPEGWNEFLDWLARLQAAKLAVEARQA